MKTVVGILRSRSDAELVAERLRTTGLKNENINLLTPDTSEDNLLRFRRPTLSSRARARGWRVVGGALGAAEDGSGRRSGHAVGPGVGSVLR
jgi:hypothetical protein